MSVQMRWGVRIPLRDGTVLHGTLYLPQEGFSPSAALVTMTPYTTQSYHHEAASFAGHGYPALVVDVRGRGNSEGVFKPFINEGSDGHDVVEWMAGQSCCDGRVGMWGGSYGGYCQWATALESPPHLGTIVPVSAPYLGVDFPMRNNIFPTYLIQWLTHVSGRTSQLELFKDQAFWSARFLEAFTAGIPFKELDTFAGNPSSIFQEWIAHPEQDGYWDAYNGTAEAYARLSIPVLTITGSYDDDQPGALRNYREHVTRTAGANRAPHYLIMGPWDHLGTRTPRSQFLGLTVGPEAMIDLRKLHREWFAWTLQGGPQPELLRDGVACYVLGEERWRYAPSLEALTSAMARLYLRPRHDPADLFAPGLLSRDPPGHGGLASYVYDPRDVSFGPLEAQQDPESRTEPRPGHLAPGTHLIYQSDPLDESLMICGFFRLTVWLAMDQRDTDVRATIYEVEADGSMVLLTEEALRARYRESLRRSALVRTSEALPYTFQSFMFVARRLRKGSRLQLVLGPLNSIYSQKNYNAGGTVASESFADALPVKVTLYHDPDRPSILEVPCGQAVES